MLNYVFLLLVTLILHYIVVLRIKYYNKIRKIKYKSTPVYYALFASFWNILLLIIFVCVINYLAFDEYVFLASAPPILFTIYYLVKIRVRFKSREKFEKILTYIFAILASCTIFITIMIVFSIFLQANKFFQEIPVIDFLFGLNWNPQNEISTEVKYSFGLIPVIAGTCLITIIAIMIAGPIGIFSAVYLSEYSSSSLRKKIKPLIEVLAGIPTVVYGYFATVTVSPFIKNVCSMIGVDISLESALCVGIVMGIMIMPYILTLTDDVINAVPQTLRDASYALGATKSETIVNVVLPAGKSGIYSALLLAISRAIGETMIVAMAAGLSANLTLNPLESVTTATVQIVALLTGDQEFNSIKTNAAFALAFVLFVLTFIINILSQIVMEKGKVKYE